MTEQILRNNITFPNVYYQKFALTENTDSHHQLSLKPGDRDLLLKDSYGDKVSPCAHREKIYFKDGRILRSARGGDYTSVMPKKGTGRFQIFDGDLVIFGELQEGKISKIEQFLKRNHNIPGGQESLAYGEGLENVTRRNIEKLLKSAQEGTLKLQNLTKGILKKYLAFLPK